MKKIKTLLLPIATITSSAAIVAPLLTCCSNNNAAASTEIPINYEPTNIEKHPTMIIDPDEASIEYIDAIKDNANIIKEDYKFSAGQIYAFVDEYVKEIQEKEETSKVKLDLNVNSFKAGLTDFVFADDFYSYRNGMTVSAQAKLDLSEALTEQLQRAVTCKVEVNLNNIGFETSFVNFDTFDVTHKTSILDGAFTAIKPVFPSILTRKNWSVSFKAFGGFNVKLNDENIIDINDLGLDYKFDYSNILPLLSLHIGEFYLIDALQELGTFASYYMSDVDLTQRLTEKETIIDVNKVLDLSGASYWTNDMEQLIEYNNPAKHDVRYLSTTGWSRASTSAAPINFVIDKKDYTKVNGYLTINDTYYDLITCGYGAKISYSLNKYRQDSTLPEDPEQPVSKATGYRWRERHIIFPRFNQTMNQLDLGEGNIIWCPSDYGYPTSEKFYQNGSRCVFNLKLNSETGGITQNSQFAIDEFDYDQYDFVNKPLSIGDVKISVDDKELTADKDFKVVDNQSISFLNPIEAPTEEGTEVAVKIELTTTSTYDAETYEDGSVGYIKLA